MNKKGLFSNMTTSKWISFGLWMTFCVFLVLIVLMTSLKGLVADDAIKGYYIGIAVVGLIFFISFVLALVGSGVMYIIENRSKKASSMKGNK